MSWLVLTYEVAALFEPLTTRADSLHLALDTSAARRRAHACERQRERWQYLPAAVKKRYRMHERARRTHDRLSQRAPIACANPRCAAVFVPYRSDTRYCTSACQRRARGQRAYYVHRAKCPPVTQYAVCPACEREFAQRRRDQVHCERTCQDRARYLRRRATLSAGS